MRKISPDAIYFPVSKKMSFSVLPTEIKLKIFKMLDIGSRYIARLVWEEMMDETLKSIPSDPMLVGKLKKKVTEHNLETAGVLALESRLDCVEVKVVANLNRV